MLTFNIVAAVDKKFGIGNDGQLPWHLSGDLRHFKEITTKTQAEGRTNAVIMGRKTWDSIPEKFRPLPDRINCVLSRDNHLQLPEGVLKAGSLNDALSLLAADFMEILGGIYVIGGARIFAESIKHSQCRKIYLTHILKEFSCDTFFPQDLSGFQKSQQTPSETENQITYSFAEYIKK